MENKLMSALCLCRKAGKLLYGFDPVKEQMQAKGECFVLTAQDLSPKSRKNIRYEAEKYHINVEGMPFTMDEIRHYLGKRSGILAVVDPELARLVKSKLRRENEED